MPWEMDHIWFLLLFDPNPSKKMGGEFAEGSRREPAEVTESLVETRDSKRMFGNCLAQFFARNTVCYPSQKVQT
jgi:hypothetical protein